MAKFLIVGISIAEENDGKTITHIDVCRVGIIPIEEIARSIETGKHQFYYRDRRGESTWITVSRTSLFRPPVIKTEKKRLRSDPLYFLPQISRSKMDLFSSSPGGYVVN